MSKDNIIKFYKLVAENPKLKKKMQKIEDKRLKKDVSEKIVALAGKMNIYFTEDEINDYFLEKDSEMDRSESQKVSGGKKNFTKGEIAAAKVARKAIVNSATSSAQTNYSETYKERDN